MHKKFIKYCRDHLFDHNYYFWYVVILWLKNSRWKFQSKNGTWVTWWVKKYHVMTSKLIRLMWLESQQSERLDLTHWIWSKNSLTLIVLQLKCTNLPVKLSVHSQEYSWFGCVRHCPPFSHGGRPDTVVWQRVIFSQFSPPYPISQWHFASYFCPYELFTGSHWPCPFSSLHDLYKHGSWNSQYCPIKPRRHLKWSLWPVLLVVPEHPGQGHITGIISRDPMTESVRLYSSGESDSLKH